MLKNHKSEEGDLVPVRKGRVEEALKDGDRVALTPVYIIFNH
jgi:hypothetical protein